MGGHDRDRRETLEAILSDVAYKMMEGALAMNDASQPMMDRLEQLEEFAEGLVDTLPLLHHAIEFRQADRARLN
jgi:hypothetical protein